MILFEIYIYIPIFDLRIQVVEILIITNRSIYRQAQSFEEEISKANKIF